MRLAGAHDAHEVSWCIWLCASCATGWLQELQALIKYIQQNKATDSDWFTITSNKEGTKWSGRCWYIHNLLKYDFAFEFDVPATYPATAPEIRIPELDGKTAKMYRGGAICLTVHFKPLWAKNRYEVSLCGVDAPSVVWLYAFEVPPCCQCTIQEHMRANEQPAMFAYHWPHS